jgi:hypothetical protein
MFTPQEKLIHARNSRREAAVLTKRQTRAQRTQLLALVFGPQSNKDNSIQIGINENTLSLVKESGTVSLAKRKVDREKLRDVLEALDMGLEVSGWPSHYQSYIRTYFLEHYGA